MIKNIVLVGLGGSAGSIARYLCQKWVNDIYQHNFPLATFLINITGSFLIGAIFSMAERTHLLSPQLRLLLATGFCGGFTTFSTFAFENMNLLRTGDYNNFAWYTAGSLIAGIGATVAGFSLIKII